MHTAIPSSPASRKAPWNKRRLTGQKRPLKPKKVWAIRVRLQLEGRKRDLVRAAPGISIATSIPTRARRSWARLSRRCAGIS